MPELDAEHRDQMAEALRARVIDWNTLGSPKVGHSVSDYLTDALAPLVAGWLAEAEAKALTETADRWQWGDWTVLTAPIAAPDKPQRIIGAAQAVTDWLRARVEKAGGA